MWEGILAFGGIVGLLVIIYAIWLFFFPIIVIGRLDTIIGLLKRSLPGEKKEQGFTKVCPKCKKVYGSSYDYCAKCGMTPLIREHRG